MNWSLFLFLTERTWALERHSIPWSYPQIKPISPWVLFAATTGMFPADHPKTLTSCKIALQIAASCRYGTVKIEDLVWSRKNCNTLDSKDTWMIIWVCGKYTAMMMMFRFIMMMMDAFSLRQLVHKECASFYRDSWYTWRLHQW
ncbi:uncharacterized protein [Triticum aestivum]|uniref:uncharacterized protein isoform X3 n=1 Tax=Triticum aestivum TaxID=4565 RepID=UPI001D010C3A|nr:uncharacterized protein LOC123147214 isoform X3 [Triticum aestivum]